MARDKFTVWASDNRKDTFDVNGHILVAGATGSGKSAFLHRVIWSAVMSGHQVTIIDPKMIEYKKWNNPHVLNCPVQTTLKGAMNVLQNVRRKMMKRYDDMKRRGLRKYDGAIKVIVIDEVAELTQTMDKEYNREAIELLSEIARLGNAAEIYLVIATQFPTAKVLPMQLLMNINYRICLKVSNPAASRFVLGHAGAENLNGAGDTIIQTPDREWRTQLHYTTDDEIEATVQKCIESRKRPVAKANLLTRLTRKWK